MQTLAADVDAALRARGSVELVALRMASLAHLAWFLPWAMLRTAVSLMRGNVECVVCGDAIVWVAVSSVARLARAQSSVMALGSISHTRIPFTSASFAGRCRVQIGSSRISTATEVLAAALGVDPSRIAVVPSGGPGPGSHRRRPYSATRGAPARVRPRSRRPHPRLSWDVSFAERA